MKFKRILIILIIMIIIASVGYPLLKSVSLTGETIKNEYTFTKAICDENNLCQDYEIHCKDGKVTNEIPIRGSQIQYSENWVDPRTKEQIENMC